MQSTSVALLSLGLLLGNALAQPLAVSPVVNVHVQARARWVEVAKMAHQVGMWDDVANAMKNAALLDANLSEGERRLLTAGFWMVAKPRMEAIDSLSLWQMSGLAEAAQLQLIEQYSDSLQSRLQALCRDFITLIDQRLLPTAVSLRNADAKDFWLLVRAEFDAVAQDPAGYAAAKQLIEEAIAVEILVAADKMGEKAGRDGEQPAEERGSSEEEGGRRGPGRQGPGHHGKQGPGFDLFGTMERAWNAVKGEQKSA